MLGSCHRSTQRNKLSFHDRMLPFVTVTIMALNRLSTQVKPSGELRTSASIDSVLLESANISGCLCLQQTAY